MTGRGLFLSRLTLALTRLPDDSAFAKVKPAPEILFNLTFQNAARDFEQYPFLAEVNPN